MPPSRLLAGLLVLAALVTAGPARAQSAPQAAYQLRGGPAHAGLPFIVDIVVEGFDEAPAPTAPTLNLPGGTATPAGIERRDAPTVIINGRRVDQGTGAWVISYRIDFAKGGTYTLPAVTVTQGGKQAVVRGGRLQVADLKMTDDMAIEVLLPERPVYVGETIPVEIAWLLRVNPQDQQFSVPLLGMDQVQVSVLPPTNPRQVVKFAAGTGELQLGYQQDEIARGGAKYTRFRFPVLVTPLEVGALDIAPANVVAQLETGVGRDSFGFPTARTELFRASDRPRRLEVRPLPETGKPASFGGAVGASFSIAVRASRSVVQLGEPVELEITVKSAQRLDAVGLPPLDGPGMLPRDTFVAPADPPVGELAADGLSKTFRVSVQVVSDKAREIPALAFSYFDPDRTAYQTIHSDPIALSVKGGAVVGAAQVVGGGKDPGADDGAAALDPGVVSLVGVDLALSAPGAAGAGALPRSVLWALVAALYLVPLVLLGLRSWRARTAGRREEAGEVKTALRALRDELERARKSTAKEAAVALPRALRAAAKAVGRPLDEDLIVRIENAGFAPGAGADPLSSELRNEVADVADGWAKPPRAGGPKAVALVLGLGCLLGSPALARAADPTLAAGRTDYQAALAATDPEVRQRNFATAAAAFAQAARAGRSAVLYTDWGNAALGAGDLGGAALAYRRALALDAADGRARLNLAWLRSRMPDDLRPPPGSATETLFFFHGSWSRDRRLIVGAIAFALAVLVIVPWRGRRRAWASLAIAPALVWIAMTVSLLFEDRHPDDAVLMRSLVLRVADSAGAPPKRANPLPAGIELAVVEQRSDWARVRLPNGSTGWVPTGSLERVSR